MDATLSPHLQTLVRIVRAAGEVVMRHYEAGCDARVKADRSPVTDADEEAEKLILAELNAAFPGVPVVAEEAAAAGHISKVGSRFFLVDPVDGTKEFVKRGGEFTVNIGEIVDGQPVSGVVLAPAIGRLFVGAAKEGAFEVAGNAIRDIACRKPDPDGLVAISSRSHPDAKTDELLKSLPIKGHTNAGSSLKFCLVRPTSIPAPARPWNGIPPPVMRCCGRRAAM
jgi:3'(2'), 5'-bisphosphate nucleotidase